MLTRDLGKIVRPLCLIALWLFAISSLSRSETITKLLAPGISYTQEIDHTVPLVINVVTVDLTAPGVQVRVGIGQDRIMNSDVTHGRESVSRLARRHNALVAINADFFPFTGDPLGIGIQDGELFSEPWTGNGKGGPRSVLGISSDNQAIIENLDYLGDLQAADQQRTYLNGIDRSVAPGEIVAFTSTFGSETANKPGGTEVVLGDVDLPVRANKLIYGTVESVDANITSPHAIVPGTLILSGGPGKGAAYLNAHFHVGDRAGFVMSVAAPTRVRAGVQIASLQRTSDDLPSRSGAMVDRDAYLWSTIRQAVGGGPRLLTQGKTTVDSVQEGFDSGFVNEPHPRTAAGVSSDGHHLILVTVDGGTSISRGVSLQDLAAILKRYGASDAINLDGGGSTSMAIAGLPVDHPGDGSERAVADMLLICSTQAAVSVQPPDTISTTTVPPAPVNSEIPAEVSPTGASPSIDITVNGSGAAPNSTVPPNTTTSQADPTNSGAESPGSSGVSGSDAATETAAVGRVPPNPSGGAGAIASHSVDPEGSQSQAGSSGGTVGGGAAAPDDFSIHSEHDYIPVGGSTPVLVVDAQVQMSSANPAIIWQGLVRGDVGFVTQKGTFIALKPGTGVIAARYDGQLLTTTIHVGGAAALPGVASLSGDFSVDPSGLANRVLLTVRAADRNGAPVGNVAIHVEVSKGAADLPDLRTNEDGYVTVGVEWTSPSGGTVTISGGSVTPVMVHQIANGN